MLRAEDHQIRQPSVGRMDFSPALAKQVFAAAQDDHGIDQVFHL